MAARYPHMREHEAELWQRYVEQYGMPPGEVTYDVHLGDGAPVREEWEDWVKVMVKALSTKRVDVVAETPWQVTIFEVKKRAGLSAVGQLLGYEALWFKHRGGWKPVNLVCICEQIEPDMRDVFDYYKIQVVELGPANSGAQEE